MRAMKFSLRKFGLTLPDKGMEADFVLNSEMKNTVKLEVGI